MHDLAALINTPGKNSLKIKYLRPQVYKWLQLYGSGGYYHEIRSHIKKPNLIFDHN